MKNTVKFLGRQLILTYEDGEVVVFEMEEHPSYKVGTEWIDINDERYFLKEETSK